MVRPRTPLAKQSETDTILRRLLARQVVEVPVGGMVLWPAGADVPPSWMVANGATFSTDEETGDGYPELGEQLGASRLPNPPTPAAGLVWLIRVE